MCLKGLIAAAFDSSEPLLLLRLNGRVGAIPTYRVYRLYDIYIYMYICSKMHNNPSLYIHILLWLMLVIIVAYPYPLSCCIKYTAPVSLIFGAIIPTSFNIVFTLVKYDIVYFYLPH